MINVYIANLGKYNEGCYVGDWLELPCSEEEMHDLFVKIKLGVYDENGEYHHGYEEGYSYYEEFAIHDYETDLDLEIKEYQNLSELNEIAEQLANLKPYQLEDYKAIYEINGYIDESLRILNNGDFIFLQGVSNNEELGRYVVEEGLFGVSIPNELMNYIDFEAIGDDWSNDYDFVDGGAICITA